MREYTIFCSNYEAPPQKPDLSSNPCKSRSSVEHESIGRLRIAWKRSLKRNIGTNSERYTNHPVPRFARSGKGRILLGVGPRCIVRVSAVDTLRCCVMHVRSARSSCKKGFPEDSWSLHQLRAGEVPKPRSLICRQTDSGK